MFGLLNKKVPPYLFILDNNSNFNFDESFLENDLVVNDYLLLGDTTDHQVKIDINLLTLSNCKTLESRKIYKLHILVQVLTPKS